MATSTKKSANGLSLPPVSHASVVTSATSTASWTATCSRRPRAHTVPSQ